MESTVEVICALEGVAEILEEAVNDQPSLEGKLSAARAAIFACIDYIDSKDSRYEKQCVAEECQPKSH